MKKNNPLISIIIVNYNGRHFVEDLVKSIRKSTYKNYEIIVVDNNSPDKKMVGFEKDFPDVKVILHNRNDGFGAGINLGAEHMKGEYLFFLNNDIEIAPDCLEVFAREAKNIMVPKILLFQKKTHVNSFGIKQNYLGLNMPAYLNEPDRRFSEKTASAGGIMCLRKEIFEEVGGFDTDFFLYHEDSDLSWRLRLRGYEINLINDAVIYHKYHYSVNTQKVYNSEKNRIQLVLKCYSTKSIIILLPMFMVVELSQCVYALMTGWFWKKIGMYFDIDYKKLFKKRKIVQKTRKIKDREFFKLFVPYIKFELIDSRGIKYVLSPMSQAYWKIVGWMI
ncbi:MAG: glycosyltransferase family 2 protein [Candidatus Woesearchaeota archaeon]